MVHVHVPKHANVMSCAQRAISSPVHQSSVFFNFWVHQNTSKKWLTGGSCTKACKCHVMSCHARHIKSVRSRSVHQCKYICTYMYIDVPKTKLLLFMYRGQVSIYVLICIIHVFGCPIHVPSCFFGPERKRNPEYLIGLEDLILFHRDREIHINTYILSRFIDVFSAPCGWNQHSGFFI